LPAELSCQFCVSWLRAPIGGDEGRLWGLLDWQRRLERIPTRLGTVTRQTSNAYKLVLSGLAAIDAAVFRRAIAGRVGDGVDGLSARLFPR
jgi:hypothetical protein